MDGRIKHKTETRIDAARLFDAGFGYKSVASQLLIPLATSRMWLDSYKQGRLIGLIPVSSNKTFSAETKLAAVEMFLAGSVKTEVMAQFNITTRAMLDKWVVIYRNQGPEGLKAKSRGRPKKNSDPGSETDAEKIFRLEMEVEVLKKLIALRSQEEAALLTKRRQSRH